VVYAPIADSTVGFDISGFDSLDGQEEGGDRPGDQEEAGRNPEQQE
jgi:hypothetical protein